MARTRRNKVELVRPADDAFEELTGRVMRGDEVATRHATNDALQDSMEQRRS